MRLGPGSLPRLNRLCQAASQGSHSPQEPDNNTQRAEGQGHEHPSKDPITRGQRSRHQPGCQTEQTKKEHTPARECTLRRDITMTRG